MKLLVPPPLVFLLAIILTYATQRLFPVLQIDVPLLPNVGLAIAALGVFLALVAISGFVARKTTVSPHHPERSSALVTDGVYGLTRNPMYMSLALIAAGAALMQATPVGLVFVAIAVWYITRYQIKPEEEALSTLFGADYDTYRQRVRRWI
ncbi:MAG: isoprenylcysteine carboxylmethyltransferase family protein [Pseudomonadota bacterium]